MTVRILVRCLHGLEWVCAAEVAQAPLDAQGVALSRREVRFTMPSIDVALLALRTADDVFVEVGRADTGNAGRVTAERVAETILGFTWTERVAELAQIRDLSAPLTVDVVASVEGHATLTRFAVENAVGPRLASELNGRYLVRTPDGRAPGEPNLSARIFVREGGVVAAVRLGAVPLHRREYKQATGRGTLHPPVAAALAQLAAPGVGEHVLDPFCGDGSIVIETSLAFPSARVAGSDIDAARLANAARNADRAGVDVSLQRADAGRLRLAKGEVDAVITNPPWNLSVGATGSLGRALDAFWSRLPQLLGNGGRVAVVSDADMDIPSRLEKRGFGLALATRIRLAGRMSHLVVAGPAGQGPPLAAALSSWRGRAVAEGVVTHTGF